MSREILLLVDALAREKNVSKDIVFGALELALASAAKKKISQDTNQDEIDVRVSIDRQTGAYETFRRWTVVEDNDHEFPSRQIAMSDAAEHEVEAVVGTIKEEPVEAIEFGRIQARLPSRSSCRRFVMPSVSRCSDCGPQRKTGVRSHQAY